MAAVETWDLTKEYGSHPAEIARRVGRGHSSGGGDGVRALDHVSVAVREGEIFGFLGPNGAGKTTMIRLLLGFLHPTTGRAAVLGLATDRQSVEIRRRVGYLPGGIALYDGLTGERLLDYLGELTGRPSIRRRDLCDRLELSARTLRRPVRDYSRGMRQKLGIIQALQHDPELAILDEPSEGLDPLMQRAFYGILEELRVDGRTVFFSSHVLSEVERVCDRVAIVRRGQLVALEEVGALLARRRRHVEMRLDGPAPSVGGVAGVSRLTLADGLLSCDLEGDMAPFLRAIEGAAIRDLTIEPAHLEEAFLEFYAGESENGGSGAPEGPVGPDAVAAADGGATR